MKILKFGIITILLSFMTSCDLEYYSNSDKGVVVRIEKVNYGNEVTIRMIKYLKRSDVDTYITFLTNKQYNINDTVYFTNLK